MFVGLLNSNHLSAFNLKKSLFLLLFTASSIGISFCKNADETSDSTIIKHHSPRKAMLYSAILPGMGQIYNGKIWKVPILVGGEGTAIYFYKYYQERYKKVLNFIRDTIDNDIGYEVYGYNIPGYNMERARDIFRRYRDYSMLFIVGIYVLNIVDALVDAHFFEYDISNDLSMKIQPMYNPSAYRNGGLGLNICLRF